MKKWFFLLVILLLLGYGAARYEAEFASGPPLDIEVQVHKVPSWQSQQTIQVDTDQIYKGNLLLVNKDYPVPPESEVLEAIHLFEHQDLVQGFGLLDSTIRLPSSLLQKFSVMVEAAGKDGVNRFLISSGYRDDEEQRLLYEQMGSDYALPAGYSEHNLGLSLDIGSSRAEMSVAPEGAWLKNHAWEYGFVLRYPKDKTAVTGIEYEPWHFRYVGLPHSAIMQAKHFVLEEYLDYLKQHKAVRAVIGDEVYDVLYYPISRATTIQVPADGRYEISGNNMDGIIVTVRS